MRSEFSAKVKMFVYERCLINGRPHCELCDKLILGVAEFDHIKPDGLGGKATIENCMVLCGTCHRKKTHTHDRPTMQKADNQRKAAAGIKRKGRKIQSRGFKQFQSNTVDIRDERT